MKLTELLGMIPFYTTSSELDHIEIHNIEMDSRKVQSGDLFVCIPGFTVDGHDYAKEAEKKGAVAIIAEKNVEVQIPVIYVSDTSKSLSMLATHFYNYPTKDLSLIGVTGTNGKTTVTYLLEEIFQNAKQKTGVIGTIQTKIGEETYPVVNTTPNSLELQQIFKKMVNENVDTAIMEVSSHALDLGRVHGSDYQIAIFTNLSQDHLDYHKNMDDYLHAKSLLFSQLGNGYQQGKQKFAILNADDSSYSLLKHATAQSILTYGCNNEADVMAKNIQLSASGTSFHVTTPVGEMLINCKLIGMFNVYNMLAAISAAIASGISLEIVKRALEDITGVNGRFEVVTEDEDYTVIVDYAHTPDSLENVLKTVKEFVKNKVYVVVGCGGDRDRTKRPLMAKIAATYADHAIYTSDNPRTEDPVAILNDMTAGVESFTNYQVIVERKDAIHKTIQQLEPGDVLLIAGKGHETYQQIGHVKHDFDDREVARTAIRAKGK